jgi:hypothetical protein
MEAKVIIVDRIANVAMANGLVRIECTAASASGLGKPSGTVLISAVVAGKWFRPSSMPAGIGQEGPRGYGRRVAGAGYREPRRREALIGLRRIRHVGIA